MSWRLVFKTGDPVKTRRVKDPLNDWSEGVVRRFDASGVVVSEHDAHGHCFGVQHSDGVIGFYEPRELYHQAEAKAGAKTEVSEPPETQSDAAATAAADRDELERLLKATEEARSAAELIATRSEDFLVLSLQLNDAREDLNDALDTAATLFKNKRALPGWEPMSSGALAWTGSELVFVRHGEWKSIQSASIQARKEAAGKLASLFKTCFRQSD